MKQQLSSKSVAGKAAQESQSTKKPEAPAKTGLAFKQDMQARLQKAERFMLRWTCVNKDCKNVRKTYGPEAKHPGVDYQVTQYFDIGARFEDIPGKVFKKCEECGELMMLGLFPMRPTPSDNAREDPGDVAAEFERQEAMRKARQQQVDRNNPEDTTHSRWSMTGSE